MARKDFIHFDGHAPFYPLLNQVMLNTINQMLVISQLDKCNSFYTELPLKMTQNLQLAQNVVPYLLINVSLAE